MVITVEEAKTLFQKWRDEKRPIHCVVVTREIQAKILGCIDDVEGDSVRLSQARTKIPLGDRTFLEFRLSGSDLDYSDAAHMKESVISRMKGHDAILTVTLPSSGTVVGFDVLAPLDELLNI